MPELNIPAPSEKQRRFFADRHRCVAYGGARGGGKSWAVRVKAVLLCLRYAGIKVMIVRRSYPELQENHILPLCELLRCHSEDPEQRLAVYSDTKKHLVFPNGSRILFRYCEDERDVQRYGTYTSITDKLELRAYDDVILGATEEMGASAAETQEKLIRDALLLGTNVLYCDNVNRSTGAVVSTPTTAAALGSDDTAGWAVLSPAMVNKAVTILKKNRAPRLNGRYYAVIHPSVAHDLRACEGWIEAHKYAAPEELFNGEIGELHGVRFVENAFAPVLKGADLASDSRTLAVDHAAGYSGAITTLDFDGGTVAQGALVGRTVSINGVSAKITANTASALTFASTNFGSVADGAVISPADYGPGDKAAYATWFFGKDAFGIIDPEGGALEMIVHDKGEIGGPLNQFSTIGYKFETNGATILYPERLLRVMSTSSFSATDELN